jgi:hypothetical protein
MPGLRQAQPPVAEPAEAPLIFLKKISENPSHHFHELPVLKKPFPKIVFKINI